MSQPIRSIAILNPLGDYGINAYSFELAQGLAVNGVQVDLYTSEMSPLSELPAEKRHQCFPVLGSVLLKQRPKLEQKNVPIERSLQGASPQNVGSSAGGTSSTKTNLLKAALRRRLLAFELALHLKRKHYDLIWTQWPEIYGFGFWQICRLLGMTVAHTVHNVLPHEESPAQIRLMRKVYSNCDLLFVHSQRTREDLLRMFPGCCRNVIVSPHGTYTVYSRKPEARSKVRQELKIGEREVVALVCGGIRPYKNIDGLLGALADARCAETLLIVAGEESGYPDSSPGDLLARTRRIAQQSGVTDRVRFIPRFLRAAELAELFEAADILVLPYLKNYGSGLLLLGMTFGKHIVATDTGGSREYLDKYPQHTLLEGTDAPQVAEGLRRAMDAGLVPHVPPPQIPELEWPTIMRNVLTMIHGVLSPQPRGLGSRLK